MSESSTKWSTHLGLDLFVAASHVAIALLASAAFEAIAKLEWYYRVLIGAAYVSVALVIYFTVTRKDRKNVRDQIEEWRRLDLMHSRMLEVSTQFLKARYQVIHGLVSKLEGLRESRSLSQETFDAALEEFDSQRREQYKDALSELKAFLREDNYLKPTSPNAAAQDEFKVTFYAVERLGTDFQPNAAGTEYLVPKGRAIPNEGVPRTQRFQRGEGASGIAWETKRTVVCPHGGKDRLFKDMWDGGGQKERYKSMICVPAIEDIPAERMNDVYGVLTVDTSVREGYFAQELEQFWGALHQPLCNLLIYCRESERLKGAIVSAVGQLIADATSGASGAIAHPRRTGG